MGNDAPPELRSLSQRAAYTRDVLYSRASKQPLKLTARRAQKARGVRANMHRLSHRDKAENLPGKEHSKKHCQNRPGARVTPERQ